MRVMKLPEPLEPNSVRKRLLRRRLPYQRLYLAAACQTNKANCHNKENYQKSFVHINLFLAELPRTNASTNKAGVLIFPTEAGVNTNQSE